MDAIDDLGDAIEASRNLLTPIRLGTWLKLAVVVVFVSSLGLGFGTSVPGSDVLTVADDPTAGGWQFEDLDGAAPSDEIEAIGLAVAGFVLVVWLCYAFLAGIMEFVFLESLRTNEVRVRRYFAANVGKGVRLFLFRLGLLLAVSALGVAPGYFVAAGGGSIGDLSPGLFGLYSLYGFALYLGYSIVRRFTDAFVAPIMLLEDRGVVSAWGRFREALTANWSEYAVYLLLAWFIYIAVLIGAWIVVVVGLFVLMIPIMIVLFILVLTGPIGMVLLLAFGPLSVAAVLLFMGVVWTPITTFFRYYALLVLGDTDEELDLVPQQRAAIRTAGTAAGVARGDDWTGTDRDPMRRGGDRSSDAGPTDTGDSWEGADPWADDDADPWNDVDGDDTDSREETDDGEATATDPWTDTDDTAGDDTDSWAGTDDADPWDETSDADDDRDGDDDERTW